MVIFLEWHRTAVDPDSSSSSSSSNGLPMTGEDTGLGALASPLAGYLGKIRERAASLENCPWCSAKGFTYALRSYHVNLQESITLCTNPQCLFPLVTRPLEDVLSSLEPVKRSKRKNVSALENEELITTPHKHMRTGEVGELGPQGDADNPSTPGGHGDARLVRNGEHATPDTDSPKVNGYQDCSEGETAGWGPPQDEDVVQGQDPNGAAYTDELTLSKHSASDGNLSEDLGITDGNELVLSPPGAFGVCKNRCSSRGNPLNYISSIQSEQPTLTEEKSQVTDVTTRQSEDLSCVASRKSDELVSAPKQLFWSNSDSLCWLDSLLAALVHCKSLRKHKPEDEPGRSAVWRLMRGYEDVSASVRAHQQTGEDGVAMVPSQVLQKASADLQSLRMSVFKLLQPKLHCKLGQGETPVFAMPLLLETDSWAERLFQSTFHWEFKCSGCKAHSKERVTKTLPTFTKIVPDWHPLHAVHFSPCNACCEKNQTRTMLLESVPPVFALHFVEGLPDSDVAAYAFSFEGKRYSVTTVVQYNQRLQHFVTWTRSGDGSWLEFDDLKDPGCRTHPTLHIPANEMHVVFWEVEEDAERSACSPSTTFAESPPPTEKISGLKGRRSAAEEPPAQGSDQSLLIPHDDTDIVCALLEDTSSALDSTVTASADTSIGAATLLDTFEGLSHDDIITLTLVEVNTDSQNQPLSDNQQTEESGDARKGKSDLTPDSSSADARRGADVGAIPSSSDAEAGDSLSGDPAGRGKAAPRRKDKKTASSQASSDTLSPPASSEPSRAATPAPVSPDTPENAPENEILLQTSPVSSTETSSVSSRQISPQNQSTFDQNARWSFLLSKHPLNQGQKPTAGLTPPSTPAPTAQNPPKCTKPAHSTPIFVKRQPVPVGLPGLKLLTEEGEGLPLKAAEMYGGFNAKSSHTPSSLSPPALVGAKATFLKPVTSEYRTNCSKMLSDASPVKSKFPGGASVQLLEKRRSQSSKVPLGLSDSQVLRYKLMKKLKAKKKKLAKLNQLLGSQGEGFLPPDSTDRSSPSAVSSSTCDDFLSDLLSPATTASNLSPDSTGFIEMITNVPDGFEPVVGDAGAAPQDSCGADGFHSENFLEDFLSQCCGFD